MSHEGAPAAGPILMRIRQIRAYADRPVLVAIDGYSGAGKSRLARKLVAWTDAAVVSVDDFHGGGTIDEWEARTPDENADLCLDWRRLRSDSLEPLLKGELAEWHPFNWETRDGLANHLIACEPRRILILDGAYSSRHELSDLVDLCTFVDAPPDACRLRLLKRDGAIDRGFAPWDEAQQYYFNNVRQPSSFDVVVALTALPGRPICVYNATH